MKRGFKKEAEETCLRLRKNLGYSYKDPIDCFALARHLKILPLPIDKMTSFGALPGEVDLFGPGGHGYQEFSAVIIDSPHGKLLIYNSFHSQRRTKSNIAHEISHVVCNHNFSSLPSGPGLIREFPETLEKEANWMAGSILIPRKGVLWAAKSGMNIDEIANHFETSRDMAKWRYYATGVAKQLK